MKLESLTSAALSFECNASPMITSHEMLWLSFFKHWRSFRTLLSSVLTPRMESAPGRWLNQIRNVPWNNAQSLPTIKSGDGSEERRSVRMPGMVIQILCLGNFAHVSRVHDDHTGCHFCNNSHVMSNHYQRHTHFFLKILKQVQHLGLNCHVQRSRWFICKQESGLKSESTEAIATRCFMPPLN